MDLSSAHFATSGVQLEPMFGEPDEGALLLAVKRGDRRAAEELVKRTYRPLFASLAKLCGGNADRAADLTQETYRKAWEAIGGFDGRSKLGTWLYRIGYNTFLNQVRSPHRLVPLEAAPAAADVDPDPPAEDLASRREEARRLRRAVLGLSEELRYAVTAYFWADVPVREIARQEGVTTVAIRKRLRKAFAELGGALSRGEA